MESSLAAGRGELEGEVLFAHLPTGGSSKRVSASSFRHRCQRTSDVDFVGCELLEAV